MLIFTIMSSKDILGAHLSNTIEVSDTELDYILTHFKLLSFKKGQAVISEGEQVNCEYFVLDGCLKAFYINDDLKMFILQFAMATWWASDYNALYTGQPATVNLDCIVDASILCLSNDDREKLCAEIPAVAYYFRWRTNKGYVAMQKRLLSLMNNDASYRYVELMKMYPQLYNLVPKHLIAAYLGVSRETLSRLHQTANRSR